MKRVIIDTQSNRLFRGNEMEQDYDQRGGLCQAGENDVVITTNPINSHYLRYWECLGFGLPHLLTAGPFDSRFTLSELIINNSPLRQELEHIVGNSESRLEFFTIEESERQLAVELGITPYCNFDVSVPLSRKNNFKIMCQEIGLPTPIWEVCSYGTDFLNQGRVFLEKHSHFLLKVDDGTGGISCKGMAKIENEGDLLAVAKQIKNFGSNMVLEKIVQDKAFEVSIHWEVTADGELKIVDIFGQIADNFAYVGAFYPAVDETIEAKIWKQFMDIFAPFLRSKGALGFYCCDILVSDKGEVYWIDFNPRKGAIIYVHSMTTRIAKYHGNGRRAHFFHKHNYVPGIGGKDAFLTIQERLGDLLVPSKQPFVVVTNPGVMEFGYVDITGISQVSIKEAKEVFNRALKRL